MKIALTGAHGFVGSALRKKFSDHIVINRDDTPQEIVEKLQGVNAVFNLAGAPIIKRWSESYKNTLLTSRIETTRKLVNAINQSDVKHFVSTSAIGVYPNDAGYDESFNGYTDDFLGELTQAWEEEASNCIKPSAVVRFGVVLGKDGGALAQMLTPFKLGVGGIIGDGSMMTSWIDIDDLVSIYEYILDNTLTGTYNATSPNPISNCVFTKALGKVLQRPTFFPIPEFVLKVLFGEGSSVLTDSKEIYPKALLKSGFVFKYIDIETSLKHLLKHQ